MRTESLWGGQQRAARRHWWREVLGGPETADWNEVFDEMVALRFGVMEEEGHGGMDTI